MRCVLQIFGSKVWVTSDLHPNIIAEETLDAGRMHLASDRDAPRMRAWA